MSPDQLLKELNILLSPNLVPANHPQDSAHMACCPHSEGTLASSGLHCSGAYSLFPSWTHRAIWHMYFLASSLDCEFFGEKGRNRLPGKVGLAGLD